MLDTTRTIMRSPGKLNITLSALVPQAWPLALSGYPNAASTVMVLQRHHTVTLLIHN